MKDGLKAGLPTELAVLEPWKLSAEDLGEKLDEAWLIYMRDRPYTAKGYLDNPHGGWMRGVAEQMLDEEAEIRRQATEGTLPPPGRSDRAQ